MPRLKDVRAFDGAENKIKRLGLGHVWNEVRAVLTGFHLEVEARFPANDAAVLVEVLNRRFAMTEGWARRKVGGRLWVKALVVDGAQICVGVRLQVSGRRDVSGPDLMIVEVTTLAQVMISGSVDVAILVVPSDELSAYLGRRSPKFSDAMRAAERSSFTDLPFMVVGLQPDTVRPVRPQGPAQPRGKPANSYLTGTRVLSCAPV